jgi:hypothetical protein
MIVDSRQGGAERFPLPERFIGMAPQEILDEYPYVWDDNDRIRLYLHVLHTQPEIAQAELDRMKDVYIYPPDIAEHIDSLLNFSTPSIQGAIQNQDQRVILDKYESQVLHLGSRENSSRAWVSESGVTLPGRYPETNIADALHTTPKRLRLYLGGYATRGAVIAQTGNFFTQLATKQDTEEMIRVGNTWVVNQIGHDLVGYLRMRYYPSIVSPEDK